MSCLLSFVKGMSGTHAQTLDPTDIIHMHLSYKF
jgi:hypothetical protein